MAPKKKTVAPPTPEAAEVPVPQLSTEAAAEVPVVVNSAAVPTSVSSPVTGTPTEIYSQLQTIIAQGSEKINEQVPAILELVRTAESTETPLLLRVRFLEFIANNVANLRDANALKKIVTSVVKVIGGEDNTPQLLISALQCFAGLGPVSMMDKSWEYLSREGADILMQVIIDKDAFSEPVRQAARKSLDHLVKSAFRPVVTKLIHWLSDDREEDTEEQISKERHMALATLSRLALSPSMRSHWTDAVQDDATMLILRILNNVDAREFAQLVRVAASLPNMQQKGAIPLLESFLSTHKLDSERSVESVAIIGRNIPTKNQPTFDLTPALESGNLLSCNIDASTAHGVTVSRLILLAARLAPAEAAGKLLDYVLQQLSLHVGDGSGLPENLSVVEAMLFAVIALARHQSVEVLQKLNDEAFSAVMSQLSATVGSVEPEAIFAVKKLVRESKASNSEAEILSCLHNLRIIAGSFASKQLPLSELRESWAGKRPLPVIKRTREEGGRGGLPPPPGTAGAIQRSNSNRRGGANNGHNHGNANKRQRTQSNRGQPRRRR